MPVHGLPSHKVNRDHQEGRMDMDSKKIQFGNATVIVHSPLANMTEEEQKAWYDQQWERKNPLMYEIARAIFDCQREIT